MPCFCCQAQGGLRVRPLRPSARNCRYLRQFQGRPDNGGTMPDRVHFIWRKSNLFRPHHECRNPEFERLGYEPRFRCQRLHSWWRRRVSRPRLYAFRLDRITIIFSVANGNLSGTGRAPYAVSPFPAPRSAAFEDSHFAISANDAVPDLCEAGPIRFQFAALQRPSFRLARLASHAGKSACLSALQARPALCRVIPCHTRIWRFRPAVMRGLVAFRHLAHPAGLEPAASRVTGGRSDR